MFKDVPLSINLANSRAHWKSKNRKRKDYWFRLTTMQRNKKLPRIPKRPWEAGYVVSIEMSVQGRMDDDNSVSRLKYFFDWLQHEGYIVNDRHLRLLVIPNQTIVRRSKARPFAVTDVFTAIIQSERP